MNGNKFLLDTNIIIYALKQNAVLTDCNFIVSIITEMELLSYPKISKSDEENLKSLLSNFEVINITEQIKDKTIELRKTNRLKLPDSIICATSFVTNSVLVTDDKKLHGMLEIKTMFYSDLIDSF